MQHLYLLPAYDIKRSETEVGSIPEEITKEGTDTNIMIRYQDGGLVATVSSWDADITIQIPLLNRELDYEEGLEEKLFAKAIRFVKELTYDYITGIGLSPKDDFEWGKIHVF